MIPTKVLLNNYIFEMGDEIVSVKDYYIDDGDVVVIGSNDKVLYIPLIEYITFVFNKRK